MERDGSSNQGVSGKDVDPQGGVLPWPPVWAVLFLDATNCMQATYWDPVTMTTPAARPAGVEKQNRGRGEAEWDEGSWKLAMVVCGFFACEVYLRNNSVKLFSASADSCC